MDTPNKPTKSNFDDCISREAVMDIISDYYNNPDTTDHEEEIIVTTVESIWGKPPYTELLDRIRAEVEKQEKWLLQAGYTAYNTDIAFDAIKAVLAERSEE